MTRGGPGAYKVKLASGRVLGPLDLERIRLLILKGHIHGTEIAREYPDGDWNDINRYDAIAELLIAKAQGRLSASAPSAVKDALPLPADPAAPTVVLPAATELLPAARMLPSETAASGGAGLPPGAPPLPGALTEREEISATQLENPDGAVDREAETQMGTRSGDTRSTYWTTVISVSREADQTDRMRSPIDPGNDLVETVPPGAVLELPDPVARPLGEEETQLYDSPIPGLAEFEPEPPRRQRVRLLLIAVVVGYIGYELYLAPQPPPRAPVERASFVRPRLPDPSPARVDPAASAEQYQRAMRLYVQDTVEGYLGAAQHLRAAASLDPSNVKALAMLASCYLNLIDSSNKDENFFAVITKLIDMSRAKAVDLPESVIADVEFYVTANKPEAAQNRIVEYTRAYPNFGPEMFFFLAYAFYARGDLANAARFVRQLPESRIYSPRVRHLRGQIAERQGDLTLAASEYRKALEMNPRHARSHLRLAHVLAASGAPPESVPHLRFLAEHPRLLAPRELAQAYQLRSQYLAAEQKWDLALGEIERAVRLDRGNSDYALQMYGLRARAGDTNPAIQAEAKMYYFLGEGERRVKSGQYGEALALFQQARQLNLKSPVPPEKIGDMFLQLDDVANAREAYKLAAERAPNHIEVWAKYIDTLIRSYEWEAAQKAMDRFRKLPVSQSAIDKLAGDIYARQNRHVEAQQLYRKAMGRDSIDPRVYVAYARSLLATEKFRDAAFFFALARRYDPTNLEAVLGTARTIARSDSIDRAMVMLQDELAKGSVAKAELLAGIAELQIQKAEWEQAENSLRQAMQVNPDYAYPWKLMGQVHLSREGQDPKALAKALEAFKSYSDRNASDPSGHLERYKIFLRLTQFEKAGDELNRIYALYPKYPALHYFKGALYSIMGNRKAALEEFRIELKNNPQSVSTLLAIGKEHLELNAPRDALEHFNKAMLIAPLAAEPKHQAAWANHVLKNFQGAVALYEAAIAIDAANPLLYKRLGMAYRELGQQPKARQAFKKYLQMEPDATDRALFERYL